MNAQKAFLSNFTAKHQVEVIEFAKRLGKIEADYVLFLARKAVCFYECLAALKLTELRGVTLSDRVLDMDLSWLNGKTIAVVDDAVIYGTSLAKITSILKGAGAKITETVVFCVNETSWQPNRISPTEPFLRFSEKETTGFCSDLVRAISVLPMPYAVDYPLIRRIKVSDIDLPQLHSLPGWDLKSHTTPLQYSQGVSTLVCSLTKAKQASVFLDEEGLAGISHLVKIRLYGRHLKKHGATWFTAMPIVVLDPITEETAQEIWSNIPLSASKEDAEVLEKLFTSATSKLRAIQFILSARVLRIWMAELREVVQTKAILRIDSNFASYSFPPNASTIICKIAARDVQFKAKNSHKSANISPLKIENNFATYEANPWSQQAALIKPFLDLYLLKEVPARQQRLSIDELPDEVKNCLNEGFSIKQLRRSVSNISGALPSIAVLSEFLDHAIDRGFVVPITTSTDGVIYRAYRYGEDIKDAEQFRQLCARCISSFIETSEFDAIPRTWLEKLLVLLFQSLLNANLLDPTDLVMGSSGTIGVRYAMHGAVVKEESPRIYSHYDGDFYVDVLAKYGFIKQYHSGDYQKELALPSAEGQEDERRTQKSRYYLPVISKDPIPESENATIVSESMGMLFGSLAARPNPAINVNDLTLLATCHSPASTAAALAAELEIARKNWRFTESSLKRSQLPESVTSPPRSG